MSWLVCYNPEIDWRTGEVKMTRCPKECSKQQRLKQGKSGWQKKNKKRNKRRENRKRKKES